MSLLFTSKFSIVCQFKNHWITVFSTFFRWKSFKSNVKFEKENGQKPTSYNFSRLFSISLLVYSKIFYPGIFLGQALWADSVSPQMNTITSCDHFLPKTIGENLVVNYNAWSLTQAVPLSSITHGSSPLNFLWFWLV